jgi:L-rhamnose-H+ transport protein
MNGSFAVPMKRIQQWKWEHTWFAYTFFAYALLPCVLALIIAPGIFSILASAPGLTLRVMFFGVLWGLGSLAFGMSLVRLGLAVGNGLISSIIVLLGSLGPVVAGAAQISSRALILFLLALVPLMIGIVLCAAASLARDRARGASSDRVISRRQSVAGLVIACASGVLSSMLNIGFAVGSPLALQAEAQGYSGVPATLAIWVPALGGGWLVNLIYTGRLVERAGSWKFFHGIAEARASWSRTFVMGLLWFGALFIYGSGASMLGPAGTVYGWAMTVGGSILTSNGWGAITGEWKGAGARPKVLMAVATALLIASFVLLVIQRTHEATRSQRFEVYSGAIPRMLALWPPTSHFTISPRPRLTRAALLGYTDEIR